MIRSNQHGRGTGNQNACGVQDGSGRCTDQGSGVAVGGVESEIGWGGEKGQCLKLAEHAVVQTRSGAHDVAVVHMVQAVLAVGHGSVLTAVRMQHGEEHHRQEYRQQQPGVAFASQVYAHVLPFFCLQR